jgi:hypothetical protein
MLGTNLSSAFPHPYASRHKTPPQGDFFPEFLDGCPQVRPSVPGPKKFFSNALAPRAYFGQQLAIKTQPFAASHFERIDLALKQLTSLGLINHETSYGRERPSTLWPKIEGTPKRRIPGLRAHRALKAHTFPTA